MTNSSELQFTHKLPEWFNTYWIFGVRLKVLACNALIEEQVQKSNFKNGFCVHWKDSASTCLLLQVAKVLDLN